MSISIERLTPGKFSALIEAEHLERYRFAAGFIKNLDVADIACGTGYGSQLLAEAGASSVCGIDISESAVEYAKEHYRSKNVLFQTGNAEDLKSIPDERFDFVISQETIHMVRHPDRLVDELHRILKPGGGCLIETPDRHFDVTATITGRPRHPFHYVEFTRDEFVAELGRKFEIKCLYGQSFISRALLFWPVQTCIKAGARLFPNSRFRNLKSSIFDSFRQIDVQPERAHPGKIPKFWIIHCLKAPRLQGL